MKKRLISIALIMILVLGTYSVALADGNTSVNATRNSLKSVGNVVYTDGENRVEIHSDDLYMLADKIDSFKQCVADQLAQNHTYFSKGSNGTSTVTDSDIKVVHTQPSNDDAVDPVSLDFDTIMEGIAASQSIPSDITEYGYADGTILYKTESGELTTDGTLENVQQIDISAAKPENLSAGSAAWVNGELILGTGSDNNAYFDNNSIAVAYFYGNSNTVTWYPVIYTAPKDTDYFSVNDTMLTINKNCNVDIFMTSASFPGIIYHNGNIILSVNGSEAGIVSKTNLSVKAGDNIRVLRAENADAWRPIWATLVFTN